MEKNTSTLNHDNLSQNNDILTTLDKSDDVAVVAVPLPAQGHLNQMLHLSCVISSYGLPVYYVSSAIHIRQAQLRANLLSPLDIAKIRFHELPAPPFACPSPDPNSSHKFPVQIVSLLDSTIDMREEFAGYLREMSNKYRRVVIVHDFGMGATVQDVASVSNAESYSLTCLSAMFMASFCEEWGNRSPGMDELKGLPSFEETMSESVLYYSKVKVEALKHRSGDIYNTCRKMEGPYLDLLEQQEGKKCWAVGPILPTDIKPEAQKRHECFEWLDQHDANSVIYISFGTTISLSDEEVKELAEGLENSKVKFLWVLRDADKANIFYGDTRRIELPEGFEERMKGMGIVVRDWVPQPEILAHPSTGGFLSHCGWNSCIESISTGVPIAAWPMHSDQPVNSVLITKILKTGLYVKEWNSKMETAEASTIESALRRLMVSEEGDEIRKRAQELGANVRMVTQPGGESRLELDSFIAHLTRLKDMEAKLE